VGLFLDLLARQTAQANAGSIPLPGIAASRKEP
jgi:hypothetical protein